MAEKSNRSEHDEVREALAELHEALAKEGTIDRDLRSELEGAAAEIGRALDRTAEGHAGSEPNQLSDTTQDLALQLEVSHPTLTGVLNRLAQQLANLGI